MSYFYPFGLINSVVSSSFALTSVTASFSASTNSIAVTASYAQTAQYAPTGPQGTSYSTVCPSGYIPCPNLSVPGYDLVCLQTGSTACGGGQTPTCPAAIPGVTTTSTTTSTSTTTTSTSTTTTTTTPAPATTTSTTTTTTTPAPATTTSTTTTTTSNCIELYSISGPEASSGAACGLPDSGDVLLHTNGTSYYSDACITLITDGFYKRDSDDYWLQFSSGLLVAGPTDCNATTTTTSTTTTGAPGECYTMDSAGSPIYVNYTSPTSGPQTILVDSTNVSVCSNTEPQEQAPPTGNLRLWYCGTSCTSNITCADCEGATTTTTTSTSTTTTSTTTTTTTLPPVATSVEISDTNTSNGNAPAPCAAFPEARNTTSILLKDQYGNNITNGATPINITIRYTGTNGDSDIPLTIPAYQLAGDPITFEYAQSTYADTGTCVNETSTINCVVSISGGLSYTGLTSC